MATKRKTPAKRRGTTVTAKSRAKKTIARKRGKAKTTRTVLEIGEFLRNRRNPKGKKKPRSVASRLRERTDLLELKKQIEKTKTMLAAFLKG